MTTIILISESCRYYLEKSFLELQNKVAITHRLMQIIKILLEISSAEMLQSFQTNRQTRIRHLLVEICPDMFFTTADSNKLPSVSIIRLS